jgi:hypothetical protein
VAKKVVLVFVGFVVITTLIVGVITALVDQKHQAALLELKEIQDGARNEMVAEQERLEEKQQEIDRLAARIKSERLALQEERRRIEQHNRSKTAAAQKQKKTVTDPKTTTPQNVAIGKTDRVETKSLPGSHSSSATQASRLTSHEEQIRRISRKAGLEAAGSLLPVKYYNRSTRELVLAEPFNRSPGSVFVRVRVWKGERLAQDTLIDFSNASNVNPRGSRPYL